MSMMPQTNIMTLTRYMIENTKQFPDAQDLEVLLSSIQVTTHPPTHPPTLLSYINVKLTHPTTHPPTHHPLKQVAYKTIRASIKTPPPTHPPTP